MTGNYTKEVLLQRQKAHIRHLLREQKRARLEKQILTGLCLALMTFLGAVLILI